MLLLISMVSCTTSDGNRLVARGHLSSRSRRGENCKYLMANVVGGLSTVAVGHPLELVKTHLQTSDGKYTGPVDCLRKIYGQGGVRALYSGVTASVCSKIGVIVLMYGSFQSTQRALIDRQFSLMLSTFGAGCVSGLMVSLVYGPMDLIRIRMQTQHPQDPQRYLSVSDCARRIILQEGPLSLLRGFGATVARTVPQLSSYYCFLEVGRIKGGLDPFVAGGIAGMACWCIGLPLDYLKTRVQASETGSSLMKELRILVRTHGIWALYRGWQPVMLRGALVNACGIKAIESTKQTLDYF